MVPGCALVQFSNIRGISLCNGSQRFVFCIGYFTLLLPLPRLLSVNYIAMFCGVGVDSYTGFVTRGEGEFCLYCVMTLYWFEVQ